jgi:hypothetical protein
VAQVHAGHGTQAARSRYGAGQLLGGDAHAHAPLHDRQEFTATDDEGSKKGAGHACFRVIRAGARF